jgi:hypothetical protein
VDYVTLGRTVLRVARHPRGLTRADYARAARVRVESPADGGTLIAAAIPIGGPASEL